MNRVALVVMVLILVGCSSSQTVQIKVVNRTKQTLIVSGRTWIFYRKIEILPGTTWSGAIDRRMVGTDAFITVEERK